MDPKPLNRQAVLEALGRFQKTEIPTSAEIGKGLANESDRGCVVIMGSLTEDILLDAVMERFVPLSAAQRKNLTRSGGLLSTWADRASMAVALGILNADDAERLEVLKSMRNACAHSRKPINFNTPELKNALCLLLGDFGASLLQTSIKRNRSALRAVFIAGSYYLWKRIRGETQREAAEYVAGLFRAAAASWPDTPMKRPTKDRGAAPKRKARPRPPRSSQA